MRGWSNIGQIVRAGKSIGGGGDSFAILGVGKVFLLERDACVHARSINIGQMANLQGKRINRVAGDSRRGWSRDRAPS